MSMGNKRSGAKETDRVSVSIRMVGDTGPCLEWLKKKDGVEECAIMLGEIRFQTRPDPEWHADLIQEMVQNDFRIASFSSKQQSLEDVFVHVTEGIVQ